LREYIPVIDILASPDLVALRAADVITEGLASLCGGTLGLATGATMLQIYARLVDRFRSGAISFCEVTFFNLDEYIGIPRTATGSFRTFMHRCFFDLVDVDPARAHLPDGMSSDVSSEALRYEALIRASGGIDLQLLGIGSNGHIGFNEPGSDFGSRTREVLLTEATRVANAPYFAKGAEVPHRAVTMGIGTILESRKILLIATGKHKAEAISAALSGPLSTACPASALRRHPNVHIICDAAAASHIVGCVAVQTQWMA